MSIKLLTNPDGFYEREVAEGPGLLEPTLVVFLAAIAAGLSGLVYIAETMSSLPDTVEPIAVTGFMIGTVAGILGQFTIWFMYAGAFQLVSERFGGTGEFRDTFKAVGWGFLPAIFAGLLSAGTMYLAIQNATLPQDPQAVQTFSQQLRQRPIFDVANVVSIVFTLWQAFIWTFAIKYVRDIEFKHAAITVAVPVGISVLWNVYTIVT